MRAERAVGKGFGGGGLGGHGQGGGGVVGGYGKGKEVVKSRGLAWVVRAAMVVATVLGSAWVAVAPCGRVVMVAVEMGTVEDLYRVVVETEMVLYRAAVATERVLYRAEVGMVGVWGARGGKSLGMLGL